MTDAETDGGQSTRREQVDLDPGHTLRGQRGYKGIDLLAIWTVGALSALAAFVKRRLGDP